MNLKHVWVAVVVIALGHTIVDIYGTTVTPLFPHFVKAWSLAPSQLGALTAVMSITGALFQPLLGHYLDTHGSTWVAAFAVLWIGLLTVVVGWIRSYNALFLLAAAGILGSAVYHPLGAILVRHISPKERRGLYMGIFMNIGNLGWAAAPALVTAWAAIWGLKSLVWLLIPGLAVAAALCTLKIRMSDPSPDEIAGTQALTTTPVGAELAASVEDQVSAGTDLTVPTAPLPWRGVLLLVGATFLRSWVSSGVSTYIPTYLVQHGGTAQIAGDQITLFTLAGTAVGFVTGWLSDRWGQRNLFAGSLLVAGVGLYWYLHATGPVAWLALCIAGGALLGSLPLTVLLIQEMMPQHAGLGSGLVMGLASGLGGLAVLGSGILANRYGLGAALSWLVPLLPVAAVLVLLIPGRHFATRGGQAAVTRP